MNWTHAWRIAWKDMRRIGALWIVLVGCWLVWFAGMAWMSRSSSNFTLPFSFGQTIFGLLWTVVIYAVAWGGLTFSLEHEEKTFDFLRSLPVHPKSVYYGKLLFGLNSILAMIAVFAGMAITYRLLVQDTVGGRLFSDDPHSAEFVLSGLVVPFVMLVGMCCSMRIKRPMFAIGAAVVTGWLAAFAVGGILSGIEELCVEKGWIPGNEFYSKHLWWLAGGLLTVASLIAFVVSRRWVTPWLNNRADVAAAPPVAVASPKASVARSPTFGFRRLLWLQRNQSLSIQCLLVAFPVLLFLIFSSRRSFEGWFGPLCVSLELLILVLGVTAFRYEHQDDRFRLLAQLGASPRSYWASQLLLPGLATVVIAVATSLILSARFIESKRAYEGVAVLPEFGIILPLFLGVFCLA